MNRVVRGVLGRPIIPASAKQAWAGVRPGVNLTWLAGELGISRPAVTGWTHVPADRLTVVCQLTGLARERLRPDLYPPPDPWSGIMKQKE